MLGRDVRGAGGGRDVSADDEVAAPTGEYPRVSSLGDENPSARPIESCAGALESVVIRCLKAGISGTIPFCWYI